MMTQNSFMQRLTTHPGGMLRHLALVLVLLGLALVASPAGAQNLSFSVEEMQVQVFIQNDSSAKIVYDITFHNTTFGGPIDIVDIGTPNGDYDLNNMLASVEGVAITDIRPSEFVNPGVEIHLGSKTIQAGQRRTLHFEFTMPEMVFGDVTNRANASFQFTPTWFGSEFVEGTTRLKIAIHLPEGIDPEAVLYQNEPFTTKALFQNHTVVAWEFPNARLTGPHKVGVSFPKAGLSNVTEMSLWGLAVFWFSENENLRIATGIISLVLFSILFFRFTGGTGGCLWFIIGGGLVFFFIVSPGFQLAGFFPLIALVIANEVVIRKKKKRYLPPIAQVEGGGIKRGLTAPEAAAILEMPVNKILTLIIFGLLKKGVVKQVKATPLVVKVNEDYQIVHKKIKAKERYAYRRKAAQANGTVLHRYEQLFLDLLEKGGGKPVHKIDFSPAMKAFLRNTARRLKGFDLSDTQEYYRRIVKRAMEETKSMGDIPEREKMLDRNMEWVLLDDDYPSVFTHRGYSYVPIWLRPGAPGTTISRGGQLASGGGRAASGRSGPGFGDVAAGFAGWTENTMGALASAILPGSIQAPGSKGGVIDLSGFDKVTSDFFEALSKSSGGGSGGGGGGGCACACAGCACACACAGGGR